MIKFIVDGEPGSIFVEVGNARVQSYLEKVMDVVALWDREEEAYVIPKEPVAYIGMRASAVPLDKVTLDIPKAVSAPGRGVFRQKPDPVVEPAPTAPQVRTRTRKPKE